MDARQVELMTEEEAKAALVNLIEKLDEYQDEGGFGTDWPYALGLEE